MLYDKEFLLKLDKDKNKIIYAKITALTFEESPVESIEGRVTQGSINLDGSSAVRRTCSITLIANDYDYRDYLWGLNSKFKVEVGVKNNVDVKYPDIIWFNYGIFLISSFNTSSSPQNFTITIQGKDKMCLLNGEVGGSIGAPTDFGCIEEEIKDQWVIKKVPIFDIIRNMVHVYAKEPFSNIVINDLDDLGLELLEYRGNMPLYLYRTVNSNAYENALIDGDMKVRRENESNSIPLKELSYEDFELLIDTLHDGHSPSKLYVGDEGPFFYTKVEFGHTAGYRPTDLVYPGDLIANVGESITSVLDKIKNMLGEYEYFYNTDGQFVFQKKQSFVNTLWTPFEENEDGEKYVESLALASANAYTFNEGELISSFNNNPNLNNMRNDYSIWGVRKGINGTDLPVHLRYAIDKKPSFYKSLSGRVFSVNKDYIDQLKKSKYDEIVLDVNERIKNFKMKRALPEGFEKPKQKEDGSWTPGWWDIRDWHDYYQTLTQKEPIFTMKWYSRNDESGRVQKVTIPGYQYQQNAYVWLIIRNKQTGSCNFQHGSSSIESSEGTRLCTKYYSYYNEQNQLITQQVEPLEQREFMFPYAGCSDTHTYLEFIAEYCPTDDSVEQVLFYNPNFPTMQSFIEIVEDEIKKEFEEYEKKGLLNYVDWREIIYQMGDDYFRHNTEDDFLQNVGKMNSMFYPTGITGYEHYYTDLQGFWRQLYYPEASFLLDQEKYQQTIDELQKDESVLNKEERIKDLEERKQKSKENWETNYYLKTESNDKKNITFWSRTIYETPEKMNFWFDFLDTEGELSQFSVSMVGDRAKAINDTNIKSIYFRETPNVIFLKNFQEEQNKDKYSGYRVIQVGGIESMFSISSQGQSAKDKLDELIYKHGYCIESVTINCIPVYYLEPNTRIHITDKRTNLDGDYIISRITVPLTYNGTMSITATKAAETLWY